MPLVSVLLPVYNGETYLEAAVRSILDQTFTDYELLILNDGSTDRSGEILARLAGEDERIQVITRENRGLVASLNELLERSCGTCCARMDADDLALPDRLEQQVQYLSDHPEVVLVGGQPLLIDSSGRPLGIMHQPLSHAEIDRDHLRGCSSVSHPAVLFRKEKVLQVGGYRQESYPAEDLDLWLRLGEVGEIRNLPEVVLRYRIHEKSISGSNQTRQLDAARRACEAAWNRRGVVGQHQFEAQPWRAGDGRHSRHQFTVRYGWMAWNQGHASTARTYALRAVVQLPWKVEGWKLLYCSLFRAASQASSLTTAH